MGLTDRDARHPATGQRGVALAIVVWFIAGMSLLVAAIVYQARLDTRMAQVHVAQARVAAAGDGAIQMMMATSTTLGTDTSGQVFRVGDHQLRVRLVPAAGLINLATAPPEMLSNLFRLSGAATEADAEILADNVIKWRTSRASGMGSRRFEAIEDLVRVEGFSRVRVDAIRDYVVANAGTGGTMNPSLAPAEVLAVIAATDPGRAASIAGRQERQSAGENAGARIGAGVYRADAVMNYGGRLWLRRRWVRVGDSANSALPWHFTRTEAPRVVRGN